MTYTLAETFDDPQGRWQEYAPWDGSIYSEADKAILTTNRHVDIRNFRVFTDLVPVPQDPDLDTAFQSNLESPLPQTSLEEKPGLAAYTENWEQTGTGFNLDLIVGKLANHEGWSGLQFTTAGGNLATFLESITVDTPVDISTMDDVAVVFPDHNSFDDLLSYIQFTSDPQGNFGTGYDSDQVFFSENTSVMPQLLIPIANFTSGADANWDNTAITGVKMYLYEVAPTVNSIVTVMAMRGFDSAWQESWLDFDTRLGAVCIPVTLDGAPYAGTQLQEFEFIRGDGTQNDPIPVDGGYNIYFYPGGEVGAQALDPLTNRLSLLLRERKDIPGGTGSYIQIDLLWNDVGTNFEARRVDITGGTTKTETTLNSYSVGGPLDPTKHYLFRVEIRGTEIKAKIFDTLIDKTVVSTVWNQPTTLTDVEFLNRTGRVGFVAAFVDRDAYLDQIQVALTGFATLRTKVYNSRSPVDGAQLAAVYSADVNLFSSVTGPDLLVDQTKTLSGSGSYRTAKYVETNQFVMDDWTQSYLDLAIWVPNVVSFANQPQIILNSTTDTYSVSVPKLQPAQWNKLHFDLGLFRDLLTGVPYSLTFQANPEPDKPLGNFWVDNVMIGRRRVAWSVRATQDGTFRYFREQINNPTGAVHFLPIERGTKLQLKAEALTSDAWVSSFKLFPRYAELGNPVYDRAFESTV